MGGVQPNRNADPSPGALNLVAPFGGRWFGLGLLLCAVATLSFVAVFVDRAAGSSAVAIPVCVLVVGLALVLLRRGATVDRSEGTLMTWWEIAVPLRSASTRLGAATHVSIGARQAGTSKDRYTVYPVRIEPSAGELWAPERYEIARRIAEQTARHLALDLHDESSGSLVVRAPQTLDEPLKVRVCREGALPPWRDAAPARFEIRHEGRETMCSLPPRGVDGFEIYGLVVGLVSAGVLGFLLGPTFPKPLVVLLVAAPLLSSLASFLVAWRARDSVKFSDRGLEWSPGTPLRRAARISAEQLEELLVVDAARRGLFGPSAKRARSVWVRGDEVTIRLGANLTEEEAAWLRGAICRAICGA